MALFRENAKVLVTAAAAEAALGTPGSVDQMLIMGNGYTHFIDQAEIQTNGGQFTGTEQPTEIQKTRESYATQLVWDFVRPNDVAFALAYLLGDITSGVADTSAYSHKIVPDESTRVLPSFTVEEIGAAASQQQYAGCFLQDWELTLEKNRPATMRASVIAAGPKDTGSGSASVVSEPAMMGSGLYAWFGASYDGSDETGATDLASVTPLQATLISAKVRVTNIRQTDGLYTFAGSTIARAERDMREYSLSLVIEIADSTYEGYLQALTTKALELDWDSGVLAGAATQNYGFQIVVPKFFIRSVSKGRGASGRLQLTINGEVLDNGSNDVLVASVWNQQSAYAA